LTSGIPSVSTPPTYVGGTATNITKDFEVPHSVNVNWLYVTVPTGATQLAVGVIDSIYIDNSDPDRDLGVNIEVVVPEPGTWMLFGAGLGALLAVRRLKVRR
jgi:hypothetical protein